MKKYLAFISYRHTEYDKKIASGLHRSLELLHVPKNEVRFKKRRLFRDEEELPTSSDLGAGINAALESSEYLIVICSPRLPESKWCLQEIRYFIDNGLSDRILPVLIEGDESISIPECIRHIPLAYDLRNYNKKTESIEGGNHHEGNRSNRNQLQNKIRSASMKLLSIMTGIKTEDIERSETMHRIAVTAAVMLSIALVLVGFTFYSRYTANRISENNTEILKATADSKKARESALNERNEAILSRAKTLAEESRVMIENADYDGAIINILPALPSDENPDYPISKEAMAVLRTAMAMQQPSYEYVRTLDLKTDEDKEIYESMLSLRDEAEYVPDEDECITLGIKMNDILSISGRDSYVALVRTDGTLEVYHNYTGKLIATSEKKYCKVYFAKRPNTLYAITEDRNIELLDTRTLEPIRTLDCHNKAKQIYACEEKHYLLITCDDSIEIFRHDNGRHMYSYPLDAEPDFAIFSDYYKYLSTARGEMFYVVFPDHVDMYHTKRFTDPNISDVIPFIDESYMQSGYCFATDQDRNACYIRDVGGAIYKWNIKTGELIWKAFPYEFISGGGADTSTVSIDGNAIWYPQDSMGSLKKLDAQTGEVIFEINPRVKSQFHESEDSNIVVLQGKYYTSNIIEGIDSTSGEEVWLWERDPRKRYDNLKLIGNTLCLIEMEYDEYENPLKIYYDTADAENGEIKSRETIYYCTDDVSYISAREFDKYADILIRHGGKKGENGTWDEEFIVDMSSGEIVKHYEGPEAEGTLYHGYTRIFREDWKENKDTGESESYYAFVDENGVAGEYFKKDSDVYDRDLVMEYDIVPFRDRTAVIFNNTLIDYETGEPLMYLDCLRVDESGDSYRLIVRDANNFSGILYLSDDMELIKKAHRRVDAIKDK